MQASHSVAVFPERDLLWITLSGFFGPDDVERFNRDRMAAHTRLTCGPNRHLTLVDVRELKLQAQDIVGLFRRIIADPTTRSHKLALVTGCAAVRMQVRRLADRPDIACFVDLETADAWLRDDSRPLALAS